MSILHHDSDSPIESTPDGLVTIRQSDRCREQLGQHDPFRDQLEMLARQSDHFRDQLKMIDKHLERLTANVQASDLSTKEALSRNAHGIEELRRAIIGDELNPVGSLLFRVAQLEADNQENTLARKKIYWLISACSVLAGAVSWLAGWLFQK